MNKKENYKKQKRSLLFWFVFLLAVSVIATSVLTTMLMDKYYFDASGAIDISPNNPLAQQEPQEQQQETTDNADEEIQVNNENGIVNPTPTPRSPGFEASDAGGVWTTNTKVDIFKSGYTNKQGQLTVKSDDGDKVIAPGTSNSFVFKLANTGNVPLDFNLDIDAATTDGYELPVKVRLYRHDNTWLLGDSSTWMSVPQLNEAGDNATMGAGKYFYYTLEWEWPFESNDSYDTATGNLAVDKDISLTIVIHTSAEESSNLNGGAGISIPNTGDTTSVVIWGTVAVLSLIIVIIIIFILLLKRREEEEEENSATEDAQIEENKKD